MPATELRVTFTKIFVQSFYELINNIVQIFDNKPKPENLVMKLNCQKIMGTDSPKMIKRDPNFGGIKFNDLCNHIKLSCSLKSHKTPI